MIVTGICTNGCQLFTTMIVTYWFEYLW